MPVQGYLRERSNQRLRYFLPLETNCIQYANYASRHRHSKHPADTAALMVVQRASTKMMVSRLRWLNRLTLSLQVASTDSKVTINRHLNCPARRTVQQDETKKHTAEKRKQRKRRQKEQQQPFSFFFGVFWVFKPTQRCTIHWPELRKQYQSRKGNSVKQGRKRREMVLINKAPLQKTRKENKTVERKD